MPARLRQTTSVVNLPQLSLNVTDRLHLAATK
jgi:hypothetical protein